MSNTIPFPSMIDLTSKSPESESPIPSNRETPVVHSNNSARPPATCSSPSVAKSNKRKTSERQSPYYTQFTFDERESRWVCNNEKCDTSYKDGGGLTTNFRNHVGRVHGLSEKDVLRIQEEQIRTKRKQTLLNMNQISNSNPSAVLQSQANSKYFTRKLVKFFTLSDTSFRTIDNTDFTDLLIQMPPKRHKLRSEIVDAGIDTKNIIKGYLENVDVLFITLDEWSTGNRAFLGVNLHFLDPSSNRKMELLIGFRALHSGASADALKYELETILEEFDILSKVRGICSDNASVMESLKFKMVQSLPFLDTSMNFGCLNHIVSLSLSDFFKDQALLTKKRLSEEGLRKYLSIIESNETEAEGLVTENDNIEEDDIQRVLAISALTHNISMDTPQSSDELLKKVRIIVYKVLKSPKMTDTFKAMQIKQEIARAKLLQNEEITKEEAEKRVVKLHGYVATRWNSTIFMLRSVLRNRDALINLGHQFDALALTNSDFENISFICENLELFTHVTGFLSQKNQPSLLCFYKHVLLDLLVRLKVIENKAYAMGLRTFAISASLSAGKLASYYVAIDSNWIIEVACLLIPPAMVSYGFKKHTEESLNKLALRVATYFVESGEVSRLKQMLKQSNEDKGKSSNEHVHDTKSNSYIHKLSTASASHLELSQVSEMINSGVVFTHSEKSEDNFSGSDHSNDPAENITELKFVISKEIRALTQFLRDNSEFQCISDETQLSAFLVSDPSQKRKVNATFSAFLSMNCFYLNHIIKIIMTAVPTSTDSERTFNGSRNVLVYNRMSLDDDITQHIMILKSALKKDGFFERAKLMHKFFQ